MKCWKSPGLRTFLGSKEIVETCQKTASKVIRSATPVRTVAEDLPADQDRSKSDGKGGQFLLEEKSSGDKEGRGDEGPGDVVGGESTVLRQLLLVTRQSRSE